MIQHNEFFSISQIKQKKQRIKTTHIDIKTAIFTLKYCCPTLLSREDNYFNMQYFKNIAHWKKTVKEQKTVLTAGEAAEIAQIWISDCWAHLCLCKFIWYLHYTSWLHCKLQWMCNSTLFSYISLHHSTQLCFYFSSLCLFTTDYVYYRLCL